MEPEGLLGNQRPPVPILPAANILGPPKYPKGFEKRARVAEVPAAAPIYSVNNRQRFAFEAPAPAFGVDSPLASEYFKSPVEFEPVSLPHILNDYDNERHFDFEKSSHEGRNEEYCEYGEEYRRDYGANGVKGFEIGNGEESPMDPGGLMGVAEQSPGIPGFEPSSMRDQKSLASARSPTESQEPVKVAPRSSSLYRIGPPFLPTQSHTPFYCLNSGEEIVPEMSARFDRGFERGDAGNWIGYKRNYFTLVLAFEFRGWDVHRFARGLFHLLSGEKTVPIRYFALGVSVKCSDPAIEIALVQHTPKRDKGPKLATPVYPAVPGGQLPDHQTVQLSCNKRNGRKVERVQKVFGFDKRAYVQAHGVAPGSILSWYPEVSAKVARFERIQFTASLRVKPAAHVQKHFILSVELLAFLDSGPVVVASTPSAPLLIRGRSPSKYPSERTSGFRPEQDSREENQQET